MLAIFLLLSLAFQQPAQDKASAEQAAAEQAAEEQAVKELLAQVPALRAERKIGIVIDLYEQVEMLRPQTPQVLFGLGEIYASQGKSKNLKKAREYLEKFLALDAGANMDAAFKDPGLTRSRANKYLGYVLGRKRLWVASTLGRIRSDFKTRKRRRDRLIRTNDSARIELQQSRKELLRVTKKGGKTGRLTRRVERQAKSIAESEAAIADLNADIYILESYLAGKSLTLPNPQTLLGRAIPTARISRGLDWMVENQEPDGFWKPGNGQHDIGVTGLAVLALLASGSTETKGERSQNLSRAVAWLLAQQDPKLGRFGQTHGSHIYSHLIATLALIESTRLSGKLQDKSRRASIRLAVDHLQRSRNPDGAWRYRPIRGGGGDSSVTAWAVFALTAARRAGFDIDLEALVKAHEHFDKVTDPLTGSCGYTRKGEGNSRSEEMKEKFPALKSEALTAQSLLARIQLGEKAMKRPLHKLIVERILKCPPTWDEAEGTNDFYYWLHGTQALALVGGRSFETWRRALYTCLGKGQLWNGSWNPVGPWCPDGGPTYATSIAVICLLTAKRRNALDPKR